MVRQIRTGCTFLRRLGRNKRANVMAMAAIALIPMLAMIGGAIDASRLYMAQTRLQQACDAGALAGRKAMSNVNTLSDGEKATARRFFDFNYPNGTYSASNVQAVYVRGNTAGTVNGTASLVMPTTIMRLFGYDTVPLHVSCASTLLIPNTDVMFVLDVTGSMAETPTGDSVTKIAGLQAAVKDFFSSLGPGSATGPGRIRYGFMPYSSNVNVGWIIKNYNASYIAGGSGSENWHYQSRVAVTVDDHYITNRNTSDKAGSTTEGSWSSGTWANTNAKVQSSPASYSNVTQTTCSSYALPSPNPTTPTSWSNSSNNKTTPSDPSYPDTTSTSSWSTTESRTRTAYQYAWTANSSGSTKGTCNLQSRTDTQARNTPSTTTLTVTWATRQKFDHWNYQEQTFDVSPVVQAGPTGSAPNPTYYTGYAASNSYPNYNYGYYVSGNKAYGYYSATPSTITWNGCIEEAQTVNSITASSSLTPPSGASDLDIDLIPNSTATRWKPMLRDVQFERSYGFWLGRQQGWIASGFAACPREASRLTQYTSDYNATNKTSTAFNTYVDSLTPIGGTTHDIGLIWGARFLSPNGIFASDNSDANAPSGSQISRNIVFMTDGTLDTNANGNDPWGITNLDGRIAPTGDATTDRNNESHHRRVQIICNSMKGKGFTIWVIGFGITALPQELSDCATDANHASVASNSTTLRARFSAIAQTIGGLRLSS